MAARWTSKDGGKAPDFSELFKEEFAVLLLRGKNSFGDNIYSYVKVALPNIKRLYAALSADSTFNPSDFGEVIAAGVGEPSPEIQAEIAALYPDLNQPADNNSGNSGNSGSSQSSGNSANSRNSGAASSQPPIAKKSWDEY